MHDHGVRRVVNIGPCPTLRVATRQLGLDVEVPDFELWVRLEEEVEEPGRIPFLEANLPCELGGSHTVVRGMNHALCKIALSDCN